MNTNTSPLAAASAANAEFLNRLAVLRDICQPFAKKHDQATVLIHACIGEGLSEGSAIVGVVSGLGFNSRHVGMRLNDGIGQYWSRDQDGHYTTLPITA